MKKSWMWLVIGAVLGAGSFAMPAWAQNNVVVYAAEYNQSTNRFGTINLLNGTFTKISSYGSTVMNDIAYCPTNGMLYGISNTTALVAFNKTNGAVALVANFSVSGIESLAFRQSDGVLFGATSSKLYTINTTNGTATLIGSYGTPRNLGTTGQNIRFAQDGNLYVSNTSTNTDIYRVNTTNGAATWMGEAVGYPYLTLENGSQYTYGVFIKLGSVTNPIPELATLDLNSFVTGGTNANGSTHQITINLVGAGTNFPSNFNFSGNVPQAITNLTVPVSATGPSNQTTVAGNTVVFSTVASGTPPYGYVWLRNGSIVSGQTNSSLSLTNVGTSDAATYGVIVSGAMGTVTNNATLTVSKGSATVTLGSLSQTYDGTAKAATATTIPSGLAVTFTYNGSVTVPTSAGSYTVVGTINDANYQGSATNSLVISKASSSIVLGSLSQTYSGSAEPATATTTPSGLAVTFTYNGSATVPTSAGSYTVVGTINDANYQGSATNSLVISKASSSIVLGSLSQTYSGSAEPATATTTPSGLAVTFTYNGSVTVPTSAGSYTVVGTINDANYQGSATNSLVINAATLMYTANPASTTYGSVVPGVSGSVTGFLGTDNQGNATTGTLTFTPAATSSSGVGSYAINGAGLTANNGNYTFVQAAGNATALTINALPVNLTGSRSYDGTTTVAAEILSVANKIGSDNVTVASGSGTLASANAGSEAITSFGALTLGGAAAGNYTLAGASGSVNITVSALALTVTNLLALDKVYDGTTNATLDASNAGLAGVLNGDDVALVTSNAVAYFADKNVNTNKPVTVSGLALGGAAAANYTLADPTNVTANVATAGLTVSGVVAAAKVYDGTTNAQLNGTATLNGGVSGDDVSLFTGDVSAAFANPNVGTGIPVSAGGYAITGTDAGNYTLTQPTGLAADITAATLTITAVANTKIYDGSTIASATPTTSGLQGSDTVSGLAETYDTPDAGAGKTLSISSYAINDGNSGNNYTVSIVSSTAGVIIKASGSIVLGSLSQTYNGSAEPATATTTPGGLAVTFTYNGSATVPTNAGSYTVTGTINDANYQGSATNMLVINKAASSISLSGLSQTYDGTFKPAAATTTPNGLAVSFTYNGSATVPVSAGSYTVIGTINDVNYQGSATNTLVIGKAILTVAADAKTKIYGMPNPPLTASYNGFASGDDTSILSPPVVLNTTATTASGAGNYPITASGAGAANYTIQYVSGSLKVIAAPQLTGATVNVNGTQQFVVSWQTFSNQTYQLECSTNLPVATWAPVGGSVAGTGTMVSVTNSVSGTPHCFFRVQVQ
ncbi:MAG: MBG domain-containing protein [Verrucomicrobiia bacterium]